MEKLSTPILFCFYRGLENTIKSFETIKVVKPTKIYLSSDGPLKNSDLEEILKIRKWVLNSISWDCEIKTNFRTNNLGVKKAISRAIEWVSLKEEYFFVIECDCCVHPIFLKLAPLISKKLESDGVLDYNICAYSKISNSNYDLYFFRSNLVMIWGWFVKSSTWRKFNLNKFPRFASLLFLRNVLNKNLSLKSIIFWLAKIFDCYVDIDKTWGNRYAIHCMINNIPSYIPNMVICNNIGIGDEFATNSTSSYANLANNNFNFNETIKYQESRLVENTLNTENDNFFGNELYSIYSQKRLIFIKAFIPLFFGSRSKFVFKILKPFYKIASDFFKIL